MTKLELGKFFMEVLHPKAILSLQIKENKRQPILRNKLTAPDSRL